jgi:hypothetical protein
MLMPLCARHGKYLARSRRTRTSSCLRVEALEDRALLSYGFQPLAFLGDPVRGAGFRINDFEPNGLNSHGDTLFGDDLGTTSDPSSFYGEGVFLRSHGQETLLARSNAGAPGGGTFDFSFLGPSSLNDEGDASFAFLLQPAGAPFGVSAGTYRYSHTTHTVTPVAVSGVTPVPGGGVFAGMFFSPSLNNQGALVFPGIVPTDQGIHVPGEAYVGLGVGLYQADPTGQLSKVVSPGDAAPGGGAFDFATAPSINAGGDIAFNGHVAGEEVGAPGAPPQAFIINALGSLYVKDGATGQIRSIAHAGSAAPGGGVFRQAVFPQINSRGDVLFGGDLTPAPNANLSFGVFLDSGGQIIAIARPGDAVPGGGHIVTTSVLPEQMSLNNPGDVVFNAALDTHFNGNTANDTGLFKWSHGQVSLIARTGTALPGVGTLQSLVSNVIVTPPPPITVPNSGVVESDPGQVLFSAQLTDGSNVLLLATPTPSGAGGRGGSTGEPGDGGAPEFFGLVSNREIVFSWAQARPPGVSTSETTRPPLLRTEDGLSKAQAATSFASGLAWHDRVFERLFTELEEAFTALFLGDSLPVLYR